MGPEGTEPGPSAEPPEEHEVTDPAELLDKLRPPGDPDARTDLDEDETAADIHDRVLDEGQRPLGGHLRSVREDETDAQAESTEDLESEE